MEIRLAQQQSEAEAGVEECSALIDGRRRGRVFAKASYVSLTRQHHSIHKWPNAET